MLKKEWRAIRKQKGARKQIADDGNMFTFERESRDGLNKFWRCECRTEYCKARLHTDHISTTILQRLNVHNHGSNPANVEDAKIKTVIKRRAAETLEVSLYLPINTGNTVTTFLNNLFVNQNLDSR